FALEYYGSAPSVPPQIIVPRDAGDLSALAEFLSERRGARVEVRIAERGEKRRLQQLADENARHALVSEQAATEQKRARRVDAVFAPGRPDPIVLSRHSAGLQLLQRLRDEAHRFAVGFHRQRRESRGFGSLFDDLEGVGPARRRALLQHFGSVEEMLGATQ